MSVIPRLAMHVEVSWRRFTTTFSSSPPNISRSTFSTPRRGRFPTGACSRTAPNNSPTVVASSKGKRGTITDPEPYIWTCKLRFREPSLAMMQELTTHFFGSARVVTVEEDIHSPIIRSRHWRNWTCCWSVAVWAWSDIIYSLPIDEEQQKNGKWQKFIQQRNSQCSLPPNQLHSFLTIKHTPAYEQQIINKHTQKTWHRYLYIPVHTWHWHTIHT